MARYPNNLPTMEIYIDILQHPYTQHTLFRLKYQELKNKIMSLYWLMEENKGGSKGEEICFSLMYTCKVVNFFYFNDL